ncbi:unnamed protein product [Durusdinium trenchii]|uniref:Uncharacterized protein n=1 Tax=Durusdinium trenchii TaxID=1381693 RepID=A0ABP0KHF2_9DINO
MQQRQQPTPKRLHFTTALNDMESEELDTTSAQAMNASHCIEDSVATASAPSAQAMTPSRQADLKVPADKQDSTLATYPDDYLNVASKKPQAAQGTHTPEARFTNHGPQQLEETAEEETTDEDMEVLVDYL